MGRGRRRRKRRREQAKREKGVAISTPQSTSQAESFVRGKLGCVSGGKATGAATTTKGAATTPKTAVTSTSPETWKSPDKKQLAGRPNPVNTLRFSPSAWAKLKWFRDRGSTEIGGFGISLKEEPLYVVDFLTVAQQCTAAHVEFDDDAVAKLLNDMDQKGYTPDEVLRIWLHTHPGDSASPSGQDMNTFRDVFGGSEWSIMVILAKGGECKAKLRYTAGPGAEMELEPKVDLMPPFEGVSGEDYQHWEDEYLAHVRTRSYSSSAPTHFRESYQGRGGYQDHGHSYGCYDGDEGWWNDRQNDETAGFHTAASKSSDSTAQRALPLPDQQHSARTRLSDQSEVPPYGGMYRLATRETDEKMRLVNECVEQVWQLDDNTDDTQTVVTDLAWYSFSKKARVNAGVGDDIDSINDISDEAPIACGEVAWRVNSEDKLVPMKITRVLSSGQVVDLRHDEGIAATELVAATVVSSEKDEDSTAGFAPAVSDETEEDKTLDEKPNEKLTTIATGLTHSNWCCMVCERPIDVQKEYVVAGQGASGNPGERAHASCIKNKTGWLNVPSRPSRKDTEIITISQVAVAAASKGSDEPGFGPAADGGSDDGSDGTGGDGTEPIASAGP